MTDFNSEKNYVHNKIENAIPVVLACNDGYVPQLVVCLKSIVDSTDDNRVYDIVIFNRDISLQNQKVITDFFAEKNYVKITFVNISSYVEGYILKAKAHISTETFYRFLIIDILKCYQKVLYLDCDLIVKRDLTQLFDIDLESNLIAACRDVDFNGQCNLLCMDTKNYLHTVLKLDAPRNYFQAGVLVLNVEELNKVVTVKQLFEMADTGIYKYSDQDILNIVCKNRVKYLDMRWNYLFDHKFLRYKLLVVKAPEDIRQEYEVAKKDPYVIHYAGKEKPWQNPKAEYADDFWQIAKNTPYNKELLESMNLYYISQNKSVIKKVFNRFFPIGSKRYIFLYKLIKMIKKIIKRIIRKSA